MVFLDAVKNTRLFTEGTYSQTFLSFGSTVHFGTFRYHIQRLFNTDINFFRLVMPKLPNDIFQQFHFFMPGTKRIANCQCQT